MRRLKLLLLSLCILFSGESLFGQRIVRKTFNVGGDNHSYYLLQPTDTIRGILILFPGRGEDPRGIFKRTTIPRYLTAKGYSTIVPELHYSLFADDLIKQQLTEILKIESKKSKQGAPALALGGFSAGGSVALSYGEYLLSLGTTSNLKSIFVIDPPIDLQRVYVTNQRWMQYHCDLLRDDGQQTLNYLNRALGGSPKDKYENYVALSPFLATEADGGNAKWLKQIPIRLYTEPDIEFVRNRYCQELVLEDLNVSDLEKLNSLLKASGKTCEYIVTKGRGYHTWNIAEPGELTEWIVKFGSGQ